MKKHFYFLFFFLLAASMVHAQIKKGAILAGGNVGFSTQKNSGDGNPGFENKQTGLNLSPSIGKAIKDNLVAGVELSYVGQWGKSGAYISNHTDSYGLGFFLRQYRYLGSRFSVFLQSRLGGAYGKGSYTDTVPLSQASKGYTLSFGFYPGIAYAISNRIQIETGFQNIAYANFSHSKFSQVDQGGGVTTNKTDNFAIGSGLNNSLQNFVVGMRFLFDR